MNDGTISAIPLQLPQTNSAAPVVVKVDSLPPDIQTNTVVSGQVIANENNQVSIKTDNGIVTLQAALDVDIGQKINFKIQIQPQVQQQQTTQQVTQNFVAELLNISSDKVTQPSDVSVRSTPIDPARPVSMQPPIDPVIVHDTGGYEEYKPLHALVLQMPDILNDETMDVLVKSVLKLPMQQPLPPSLQEGFEKFDQLVKLLSQANLFPANVAQSTDAKQGVQQNIVSMLQQLLQPSIGKNSQPNPLLSQEPHQFIQLQTIQPGENLSPNILVNIKQQLQTLLQPQSEPVALPLLNTSEKTLGIIRSLLPNALTSFVEKAATTIQSNLPKLPEIFNPATNQTNTPATPVLSKPSQALFTLPAIGLVLGLPPHEIPQFDQANLVLMTTPLKQDTPSAKNAPMQLIALLAPQQDETTHTPSALLPGSIIVTALKPQTDKMTSFTVLPQTLAPQMLENFAGLHPSLGDSWPALDDLWQQVLTQSTIQPAIQTALHQIIPSPSPQQFPPTMLFFLSVLKNGFTSEWIPEKHLAGLENIDKAALIKTLTQDMQAIKSRMEDAAPADSWRPLPIPLQVGDQLMRLQWFYRHPQDNYEGSSGQEENTVHKKNKTRFLLNVPKTFVGDLQIDGLVQEKNLDIILRTENMLASQMEIAIRGRYAAVLETTGMVGGISFQSGRDHYVHV